VESHLRKVRSSILVYWTGKGIHLDLKTISDVNRRDYVERLRDILTNGFWMNAPAERIEGWASIPESAGIYVKYEIPMTCFTEVRLSQAELHSQRYGLLGIGVERKFVLDRRGGPVHYVRNSGREAVVGNAYAVGRYCRQMGAERQWAFMKQNIAFMKPMSNRESDDFAYLDEHEWRIIPTPEIEAENLIVPTGHEKPKYRIPVLVGDVRLIVFPDAATRYMAFDDAEIQKFFQGWKRKLPVWLTIEECMDF
jgi:hypothetical protein